GGGEWVGGVGGGGGEGGEGGGGVPLECWPELRCTLVVPVSVHEPRHCGNQCVLRRHSIAFGLAVEDRVGWYEIPEIVHRVDRQRHEVIEIIDARLIQSTPCPRTREDAAFQYQQVDAITLPREWPSVPGSICEQAIRIT